ncbi:MAG: oxidoreductase [Myxococcales bacterium]|nr:oxidoreductase [Myxococcales bacterium]MCB9578436.1 oxidoreductase [Polyangiaceae bacterium]
MAKSKPKLAVVKLASCDGCQLSLLDLEDELLALAGAVRIAYFPEASSKVLPGRWDVTLIEGSITTAHDKRRLEQIRKRSKTLVTIGACATAGGIQALRNFAQIEDYQRIVYARPDWIETLAESSPVAEHVKVDHQLFGCPVDKRQLLDLLSRLLSGLSPVVPDHAVCLECKQRGVSCVLVARGEPCLGPVTRAGCGALCPRYDRGCFGCFGPKEQAAPGALVPVLTRLGQSPRDVARWFGTFNVAAEPFAGAHRAARRGDD